MASPTLGFSLDAVKDPEMQLQGGQLMAALQSFMAGLVPQFLPPATQAAALQGTGTMVVTARQAAADAYMFRLLGDVMELTFTYTLISVATPAVIMRLYLPDGFKTSSIVVGTMGWAFDNAVGTPMLIAAAQDVRYLQLIRSDFANWTATAGAFTTQLRGQISFPIVRL